MIPIITASSRTGGLQQGGVHQLKARALRELDQLRFKTALRSMSRASLAMVTVSADGPLLSSGGIWRRQ